MNNDSKPEMGSLASNMKILLVFTITFSLVFIPVELRVSRFQDYKIIDNLLKDNIKYGGNLDESMDACNKLLKDKLIEHKSFQSDMAEIFEEILALEDPSCSIDTYKKVNEVTFYSTALVPHGGHLYSYMRYWRFKRALFCAGELESEYSNSLRSLDQANYKKLAKFLSKEFIIKFSEATAIRSRKEPFVVIITDKFDLDLTKIDLDRLSILLKHDRLVSMKLVEAVKEEWSSLLPNKLERLDIIKNSIVGPCIEFHEKIWPHLKRAEFDYKFGSPLIGSSDLNEYTVNIARVKLCHSILTKTNQDIFINAVLTVWGGSIS